MARERFIIRIDADGVIGSRRKSPLEHCLSFVSRTCQFPSLTLHPNFSLDALIREEQVWRDDGRAVGAQRWSIHDRKLAGVVETISFNAPCDLLRCFPLRFLPTSTTRILLLQFVNALHRQKTIACKEWVSWKS